jgi:hypothetical protein
MKELPTSSIGSELLQRNEGRPAASKLEFDPQSGELRLRPRGETPSASARTTVIDQIASDGFA